MLYSVLPSALIILCNVVIVHKLFRRSTSSMLADNSAAQKSMHRIIPMLLVVSSVFVVCTLPLGLYHIGE